jgi:hypothetical protein
MNKNKVRGCITLAVIAMVLSVIAFVVPFSRNATFWIAYLFSVIAIAFQVYIFKISFTEIEDVKSKFYGFPIAQIGVIYLVAQLIISIVEMILAILIPSWVAVVINIIVTAAAVLGSIAADTVRDEIVKQDDKLKKNVTNMRSMQLLSASIAGQCTSEIKCELEKLAEEFKYSDIVSSEATVELENELKQQLDELQSSVIEGDIESAKVLCAGIYAKLNERNRLCALNK